MISHSKIYTNRTWEENLSKFSNILDASFSASGWLVDDDEQFYNRNLSMHFPSLSRYRPTDYISIVVVVSTLFLLNQWMKMNEWENLLAIISSSQCSVFNGGKILLLWVLLDDSKLEYWTATMNKRFPFPLVWTKNFVTSNESPISTFRHAHFYSTSALFFLLNSMHQRAARKFGIQSIVSPSQFP